jgi:penicillin-binding protein 2
MDIKTGAILAYASQPSFNANLFCANSLSKNDWIKLNKNIYKPLSDKVISGLYAPGSTFKMIVALTALNKGIINNKTSFFCPGYFDYFGHRFHCWKWKSGGHGHVHLQNALASSCDVFFYHLATQLDVDDIKNIASTFGMGQLTGIEIFNEKKGLIPSREWKKTTKDKIWRGGETINLSIGQGSILATPLQLVKMIAQFVNGGISIRPHLIKGNQYLENKKMPFREVFFDYIKNGMIDVINKPWGTSYASRMRGDYSFGGKTGSTQVSRITKEDRKQGNVNNRPYHLKEHALFCGFAPILEPKFAICLVVEHGGSGGKVAAPLAKEILITAQKLIK